MFLFFRLLFLIYIFLRNNWIKILQERLGTLLLISLLFQLLFHPYHKYYFYLYPNSILFHISYKESCTLFLLLLLLWFYSVWKGLLFCRLYWCLLFLRQ